MTMICERFRSRPSADRCGDRYKVAHDEEGRILAVDVTTYSNGGCSLDLSRPVRRHLYHWRDVLCSQSNGPLPIWIMFVSRTTGYTCKVRKDRSYDPMAK
jgi:hypothetical protein